MRSTHWALAYAGLILLVTLLPGPDIMGPQVRLPSALCLVCGEFGGADGILNVLLFLPLGFSVAVASGRPLRVAALMVALPVVIEVLQQVVPGRYPVLGDVVYNATGGFAGIGLAAMRERLLRPRRRLAAALTLGTGAAAGTVLFLAGVLMVPSFPATVYYGQWTADLRHLEAYEGQVLEASLGSMPLPSQRAPDPGLAVDLARSGAPLRARVIAGPAPPALAPIVSIFDEHQSGIMILGADGADLVLWLRYRANDLRLHRPDLRVRHALDATRSGDTISVGAEGAVEGYSLQMNQEEYGGLRHTPGQGWALFLRTGLSAPWLGTLLDVVWVAGLLILAGWWAPGFGWAVAALALAVTGMVVAAVVGPLMGIAITEVVAAAGGVTLGMVLRALLPKASPSPGTIC